MGAGFDLAATFTVQARQTLRWIAVERVNREGAVAMAARAGDERWHHARLVRARDIARTCARSQMVVGFSKFSPLPDADVMFATAIAMACASAGTPIAAASARKRAQATAHVGRD